MNKEQQELYEKLLKKVNEYCLGQAAEDVIAAIDDLVDTYETPKEDSIIRNEYYLGTEKVSQQVYETIQMYKQLLKTYQDSIKALNIIRKYVCIKDLGENNGDLFRYSINDKQYISSKSCNVITKEEYDILKEIFSNE